VWPVISLTIGGGGIGQVWGATDRDESVATVREAVESGITLIDVAPSYGSGEAELVVGQAFAAELGESAATLANRYALSMKESTPWCSGSRTAMSMRAAELGPLPADVLALVDERMGRLRILG